MKVVTNW